MADEIPTGQPSIMQQLAQPTPPVSAAPPPVQLAPPVAAPAPLTMREFDDPSALRGAIYNNVLASAKTIKPVSNSRFSLSLENVDYEDPPEHSLRRQKEAILRGDTLARRVRGDWVLKDPAGTVLETKRSTIAQVPYLTPRGTFILNGSEYTLSNQMRLRAGVFSRVKENGEIESHANVAQGKGVSHRYSLDPETGVFKINLQQGSMPLLPLLRAFGTTDAEIREHWGDELYAANMKHDDPRVVDKLYRKLVRKGDPAATLENKSAAVADVFSRMEFEPDVNKRTLGADHPRLDKSTILAVSRKLLALNRGEAEPDDRDHLAFQKFMGPEDLLGERFGRSGQLMNQMLWKASTKGSLRSVPVNAFNRHLLGAITDSGLGQNLEEINPLDVLDQQSRVSRLGVGGIPSLDAVPDESRSVHPSQLGFVDLLRTPESFRAGVDSRLTHAVRKGSDGRVYAPFHDPKTNAVVYKSPQDLHDLTVAFPGEMESGEEMVQVKIGDRSTSVHRDKVDLVAPPASKWFAPVTNLVPLMSTIKGQRASMGSRFSTQALSLKNAEAPHVRGEVHGSPGKSFEELYGKHMGAVFAKDSQGRVEKVEPDAITVRYADGSVEEHPVYDHFPYNRKSYLHNTPMVQPGDAVQPGQILARSNYTDDKGHVALGMNARVAYVAWKGKNYEDAWVVSESFAKRSSSEHMYQHQLDLDDSLRKGKKNYVSIFPSKYGKSVMDTMDDDGVVVPGTVVQPGHPLILGAAERPVTHRSVHAAHKGLFADRSVTWDHHQEGIVTDVSKTSKGWAVAVKSINPTQVGDKLSGRMGDKGVIAEVVPDDEMPKDPASGLPYEILANPLGVITRTNPGQVSEARLGKIVERTGKPYTIDSFNGRDMNEWSSEELRKHGMEDMEEVEDPTTGRKIRALTGSRYFMKLHHSAESKHQGRGLGAYTADDTPARGGSEGSKKLALMDVNALLSHGATAVLRDAKMIRGQKNHEYWSSFMSGFRPPSPSEPMVYRKFIDQLRGAGVNVRRKGSQLHLMALTSKDIDGLAENRELQNAETVDWKGGEMAPVKGGLFDTTLTGGHGGRKWSFIKLHEPLPNPVMEDPIRHMLGLTGKAFEAVLGGQEKLNGQTGPKAIAAALDNIDIAKELSHCREAIAGTRKGAREAAIRKLRYLKAAETSGVHPREWMLDKVPVLPPIFRPVSTMQGGNQLVSDSNYLYKEVVDANRNLKEIEGATDDVSEERLSLYNAFKGVTGMGDPVQPKNQERKVRGLLAQVFGHNPKTSVVQQKLLGTTMDLVGRAVVVPNPDLSIDEVGIPENRAWEVYSPFIVRRLVRSGMGRMQALQAVKERTVHARKALLGELDERPVLMSRAPVLHRYGHMAFFPRLTKGDVLQVSPLVVGGMNMDFDGDTSNYSVVADDDAKKEAVQKMLPSRNLISVSTLKKPINVPRQEYVGGLYSATSAAKQGKKPRVFASIKDALRAFWAGEHDPDDPVEIVGED